MAIDISKLPLSQLRSLRNCCYNLVIRNLRQCPKDDEKYRKIRILLSQFYLGIVAQNELLQECVELGWINEKNITHFL